MLYVFMTLLLTHDSIGRPLENQFNQLPLLQHVQIRVHCKLNYYQ